MRVLFVVLPYGISKELKVKHKLRSFVAHPYGILSIATYLKKNTDADVRVFDCNTKENILQELQNEVAAFKPDIVGLSMMFDSSYSSVRDITGAIVDQSGTTTIVMGGAAATASYETILKEQPLIDAICYGEGELPFLDYVVNGNFLYPSWATRGKVPIRTKVENLDEVIDIDYSFIDPSEYPMQEAFSPRARACRPHRQFFVVTSRGCPFNCNFCINSANPDKSMRYASVDAIIDHVRGLIDVYGMDTLTFYDDQILFNKKRAKELFRRLAPFNLRIECPNGLSVAFIDDELARLMKEAGMDTICLAIESGSPHVLNDIIHKPLHVEQVKPVVNILRKYDFWITGYFVVGLPGETSTDRLATSLRIKSWGLDWAGISNACPTRGSQLYAECFEKGYIPKNMKIDDLDMNKFCITTPDFTPEQLVRDSYLMNLDVNFVNNHRMDIGDYKTAMRAFQEVLERYPDHAFALYYMARCANELFNKEMIKGNEWKDYADNFGIAYL